MKKPDLKGLVFLYANYVLNGMYDVILQLDLKL